MKEHENKLDKAVDALKNQQIPPGPPPEVVESTIAKLTEADGQPDTVKFEEQIRQTHGLTYAKSLIKVAAAAVLLIAAGYATGRLAAPKPPDTEQIRAAIEPSIRREILAEAKQYVQIGLTDGYIRIKNELTEQYRSDLNRVALQTLATSNAVTNDLLVQLIESISEAQNQDRKWVAAAIKQMETNRLQDKSQLSNALATFALQTEDELIRTKQDVAKFLTHTQQGFSIPEEITNPDNSNERTEQ